GATQTGGFAGAAEYGGGGGLRAAGSGTCGDERCGSGGVAGVVWIERAGLNRLIRATYDLMGLTSFFTAGEPEVRAWTIHKNTNAVKAAGAIHSDIEKGFIRAEVVRWNDLVAAGSLGAAREKAQVKLEGKEYIVQEGDVILFRHSG